MGRKLGSKDKKPRKKKKKKVVTPLSLPILQEVPPPPSYTLYPPSVFKEYIPLKKTYREQRDIEPKDECVQQRDAEPEDEYVQPKRRNVTSLTDKRKQTEYREYCIAVIDMAQRQGLLKDLMHLMHAFRLILQGHHEGIATDYPFPQKSVISLSELTDIMKNDIKSSSES